MAIEFTSFGAGEAKEALGAGGAGAMFGAVILDMDGTVIDSERALLALWEAVSMSRGYAFSREAMMRTIGTTYNETIRIMEEAYPDAPHAEIREEMARRFREMRENGEIGLRPDVNEFLEKVYGRGISIGLCTSTRGSSARLTLENAGILKYFDALVCGDDVTRSKPDPEPYLLSAARLGLSPMECFVVEDSPSGARSALAAGMTVAVVPDLIPVPGDVAGRVKVIDSILQAIPLFMQRQADEHRE